jgi:hypothetical protein
MPENPCPRLVGPLPPDDAYVGPDFVAAFLDVSDRTLQRHRKNRTGPDWHEFGYHHVKYRFGDVKAWAASRRQGGEDAPAR